MEVVVGVRIVQCHAIMDVVIGVQYHAIIRCCHWRQRHALSPSNHVQSTIMIFPLLVPNLILLSDCINSSSLFPVAILCTLLHRENTSFEVWYLHVLSVSKCCLFHDQFFLLSNLLSSRFVKSEMGVLQFQPLSISLLLKFNNASVKRFHFVFLLHEFRTRFSKQMIFVSIKKRFRNICPVRESDERLLLPKTG